MQNIYVLRDNWAELQICSTQHAVDNRFYYQMAYVDLITRNSLARALNADPRAKILKDLTPIAHLVSGRTRLPLYAAELIEKLKADHDSKN